MTAPTTARKRIRDWIAAYIPEAPTFVNDRLSCSFPGASLYLSDIQSVVDAFDKPCGSCHPCDNYADETWRAAGRKPPHVYHWDAVQAQLSAVRSLHVPDPREPGRCVSCAGRMPCATSKVLDVDLS
jgi:hypothetical protein